MASLLGEIQAFPGAPPPWLSMALSQHSQPMLGSQDGQGAVPASLRAQPTIRVTHLSPQPQHCSRLEMSQLGAARGSGWPQATWPHLGGALHCSGVLLGTKDRTVFLWERRIPNSSGGSVKWVEFALPWYNSSGCVRIAPGTGHTWLSPRGASPFSWMGRRCCRGVPSCRSCSGCAGSAAPVWKVGGANL